VNDIGNNGTELIGICNTTIAQLLGAIDNIILIDIKNNNKLTGKIVIRTVKIEECNDEYFMQ